MRSSLLSRIKESKITTQVKLSNMQIDDSEIAEIAEELQKTRPLLTHLFLSGNNISDAGAITLARELKSFKHLIFIDLQANEIGEPGITAFLALKTTHPKITIALHGNKVKDTGVMKEIEDQVMNSPRTT